MATHGLKSCWSMPVLSGAREVLGVFAINRREVGGPTAREHELIDRFTKVAGIAIARARAEGAVKASEAELRRAHGHLTEAQRLSKTGSFITDLVADERDWSAEMFRIFEFDPATNVTNERVRGVVHPEDLAAFDDAVKRALDGKDLDFAFRIITASGNVKHLHEVAHVLEEASGHPVFIGAFHDVTETKAAEEALNRARAELTHVARAATLSALTASIAHEVNQPLAGIVTNASTCLRMLASDPPDLDGARVTAHRTIRDANRASEVIQRLRGMFARRTPATESVDLNDAAREVLALLTSELQDARVALRATFAEGLPAVCGDRVQLQQVILNLVRNAADALRGVEGRPRKLEVGTVRNESGELTLTVRDEGVGIEPGNLPRLFDAFFSTKSEGMGIGLSISRSIIEAHRGRLWATPNQGGPGMTFSFSLRSPAPEGDKTRVAPPAEPAS
jgi:PAS domain S-box-containing protein